MMSPIKKNIQEAFKRACSSITNGDALLERVFSSSHFVAQYCQKHPNVLLGFIERGELQRDYSQREYQKKLKEQLHNIQDEASLMKVLRHFRQQALVRIAWRDITDDATVLQTLTELSWVAECCLQQALNLLDKWQQEIWGVPTGRDSGQSQRLVVIGMGKLGGCELNFSSDIDLIFTYPEQGETQKGRKTIDNEQYFIRLGQSLIKVIDSITEDGFVYRVDMRLRPFGQQGRLALSFDSMEQYYQAHGRQWERYALLKARPVAGDIDKGRLCLGNLLPFIYKRYLDFEMIDSLRQMKQGIARKAKQKDYVNNIKLGPGGIREAEFIVQVVQLIHGGKIPALQIRSFLLALESIVKHDLFTKKNADRLKEAYLFLRKTENRLQQYQDQQTHFLPKNKSQFLQMARSLGFVDAETFSNTLDVHRNAVTSIFLELFSSNQQHAGSQTKLSDLALLLVGNEEDIQQELHQILADYYDDAEAATHLLLKFRLSTLPLLTERGQHIIEQLMPRVLQQCADVEIDPVVSLQRILTLIKSISRRPNYLSLLLETPVALEQAIFCCSQSAWLADQLSRFPLLLDTLIDSRQLTIALSKEYFCQGLESALQHIDRNDIEQFMECLRHYKHQQVFQIAIQSLFNNYPVIETAEYLTGLAEAILDKTLGFSFSEALLREKMLPIPLSSSGICVVAYGKVGGFEMGYGSDIDIIFLYDNDRCVLEGAQIARLVRRFMHMLTAYTASGVLYDMDMRLRPEGKSGLLATTIVAFEAYQLNKAWVWEHQALIRARPITGDKSVFKAFENIRKQVLGQRRDETLLREEVLKMRDKMRVQLDKSSDNFFDLKQGEGGLVDIEFVVQFFVLKYAADFPEIIESSSMLILIKSLETQKILSKDTAKNLAQAYRYYRSWANVLNLQGEKALLCREQKFDSEVDFLSLIA